MAKKVTIQTKNIDAEIKEKAEKAVKAAGYLNLNTAIRLFVHDLANGETYLSTQYNRKARDPEIRAALEEYSRGEYKTLDPNRPMMEQLLEPWDDEEV